MVEYLNIKYAYRYRVCRYCGNEFETPHISKTFCSNDCCDTYYNQYKRLGAQLYHILNPNNNLTSNTKFDFKINANRKKEKDQIEFNKLILKGLKLNFNEKTAIERRILDGIGFQTMFFEGVYLSRYPECKKTTHEYLIGRYYVQIIENDFYLIEKV